MRAAVKNRDGGGLLGAVRAGGIDLANAAAGSLIYKHPIQKLDTSAGALQTEIGTVADFMESYELVAFDMADAGAGDNEVIAGAVHGGELPAFC